MDRQETLALIKQIEAERQSTLVVYFTGDRGNLGAMVAEDAVLPIYRHLLGLSQQRQEMSRVDLFLYTRGGDVSTPWRIVSMIREFCEKLCVLIPYRAYSAGTMIALGADCVVMGKKAELSPIDPTLSRMSAGSPHVSEDISVEDAVSYVSFMRERANITDQMALSQVISMLSAQVSPLTLGRVNRMYSHIRLAARKLLDSRKKKSDENKVNNIITNLSEKMYSHGHAIGRKEAEELGLTVIEPPANLELLMWGLYEKYEDGLQLLEPYDAEGILDRRQTDSYLDPNIAVGVIESVAQRDIFELDVMCSRMRKIPPNPVINRLFAVSCG